MPRSGWTPIDTDSPRSDAGPSVDELQAGLGDEFEVKRRIGVGSMAVVYLATEKGLDRPVAVKVMRPRSAADETTRKRFEREAKASASLVHPHIVPVYRYGRLPDDTPYLVMRYVKGRTMEERIAAEGRLDPDTTRKTLLQVASALRVAHSAGIVHRDVRPANVLWDEELDVSLLSDFGIAAIQAPTGEQRSRLTDTGQMIGQPHYLSPEQLRDEPLTEMADIYALGVMGYELLTGAGPYAATTNSQWIRAHLDQEPRSLHELGLGIDDDLADLLLRCLNKDARHRPRAADVVRILAEDSATAIADPDHDPWDLRELVRRRVPLIVFSAGALGWILLQLVSQLADMEVVDRVAYRLALPFVGCGIVASGVIAWFHGEKGKQRAPALEWLLLAIIGGAWITISARIWFRG